MDTELRKKALQARERSLTHSIQVATAALKEVQIELLLLRTEDAELTAQRKGILDRDNAWYKETG